MRIIQPLRPATGLLVLGLTTATLVAVSVPASADTIRVCAHGCAFTDLAPALAAAHDGDIIRLGPGTYIGGVSIDVSLALVGVGPGATVIRGGGPVLTIGAFGASTEPTVSIRGVTITGGVTRSSPVSTPFVGEEGVWATGGGVEIPPNADFTGGATVTISNSVVTGNRVAPTHALPFGPPCPEGPCPFSLAAGGGIDSWGRLTLSHTIISDNWIGSASGLSDVASDAQGAGIMNWLDDVTIRHTTIRANRSSATAPNGRFGDGGGIFSEAGELTMDHSSVIGNAASLAASLPDSVSTLAIGGGVHIGSGGTGTVRHSTISNNSVRMVNTEGSADAFSAGIHVDRDESGAPTGFEMSHSVVSDNSSTTVASGPVGDAFGDSGAGEITGEITQTRMTGNTVDVRSAAGDVYALAGASIFSGTMTGGQLERNQVRGRSPHGSVFLRGGALVIDDRETTLRHTAVVRNTVTGTALAGTAEGGGIFDAAVVDGPPGGPLVLLSSHVIRNALAVSKGVAAHGGGIYIRNPYSAEHSVLSRNYPDQCDGCGDVLGTSRTSSTSAARRLGRPGHTWSNLSPP